MARITYCPDVTLAVALDVKPLEPLCEKTQQCGFLTRSDTNRPIQSQKQARTTGPRLCP